MEIGAQEKIPDKALDICWDHFRLNANQRMKTFNIYIIISMLVFLGIAKAISDAKTGGLLLFSVGAFAYLWGA